MATESISTQPVLGSCRLIGQALGPGAGGLPPDTYGLGIVNVVQGATTVRGVNTAWLSALAGLNPAQLKLFSLSGEQEPFYPVASVTDDTTLELAIPYAGRSAFSRTYSLWFATADGAGETHQRLGQNAIVLTVPALLREQEGAANHNLAMLDDLLYRILVLGE